MMEALRHWQRLFKYTTNTTTWTDNSGITFLIDPSARVKGEELDPRETRMAEALRNFACQNKLARTVARTTVSRTISADHPEAGKDLYKVLDLCTGTGTVLLALEKRAESGESQLSNALYYGAVESAGPARSSCGFSPTSGPRSASPYYSRPPKDIFSLGENELRKVAEQIRARKQKWDLVVAGTDGRDLDRRG